jgi:hypothetical protein
MAITLENRSGRLIDIRFFPPLSLDEVTALRTRLWSLLSRIEGRAVIWADLRQVEIFTAEVATRLIEMLRVDNPRVERSAYLVSGRAAFTLQVERIVNEAKGPSKTPPRRSFSDQRTAGEWVKEVLTDPAEHLHVDSLVAAG